LLQIYRDLSGQLDPNCYDTNRRDVLAVICHNTAGPSDFNPGSQALSDSAAHYLTSNDRQVSIHWVVGAEGAGAPIYRVVPEPDVAYHAGGTGGYPSHWADPDTGTLYGRYGLNQVSLGIELFGQPGETVGPNQLASLKALVLDIAGRYPKLRNPKRWESHANLEGDRTDGPNWRDHARQWVADFANGTANPSQPQPQGVPTLDNTNYNGNPNGWHCTLTDKWVVGPMLTFHRTNGGIAIFGLPITGEGPDPANPGGTVQWFERARFERHADGNTYLGLIGSELYARL